MAMCKPDLVAGVLKELGHDVPDAETLSRAVAEAATELKRANGLSVEDCLVMSPVNAKWYEGGLRSEGKGPKHRGSLQV